MIDNFSARIHSSSFRDPAGVVIITDERVFRSVESRAQADYQALESSGLLAQLIASGKVIHTHRMHGADVPTQISAQFPVGNRYFLEHERVPFISYPYEWPFALLKRAALHYLDLHLECLRSGFTFSDASAYNVQFMGVRPIFIDILSIRKYREGEYWSGYQQFCQQFLNPLLLTACTGIPYQHWFRSSVDGVPVGILTKALPLRSRFSWRAILHVYLHEKMLSVASISRNTTSRPSTRPMSRGTLMWQLESLHSWIQGLRRPERQKTTWQDYDQNTSYSAAAQKAKEAIVADFIKRKKPKLLLDIACNGGRFSEIALRNGATTAIGLDIDEGALDHAIDRADEQKLSMLPLLMDIGNPSPQQGWNQSQWQGLHERTAANGVLALALIHHLVIGRNIPLGRVIDWLVKLAPSGLIEFVPKSDPMTRSMLSGREDIFPDYNMDEFVILLKQRTRHINIMKIPDSGRVLAEYER
jgi:ribosomal protein L11 methylase PrmA